MEGFEKLEFKLMEAGIFDKSKWRNNGYNQQILHIK